MGWEVRESKICESTSKNYNRGVIPVNTLFFYVSRKEALEVYAIHFTLALSIVLLLLFNMAVLGGGKVYFDINKYGEMTFELLVLTLVVWPVIGTGLYYWAESE